jgi:predicted  nucleic acid-binding Zn-ribbon protein
VPDLENLLALQRLDTAMDQLRHRRSHLPERVRRREIDSQLTALRGELTSARREQDTASASQAELETSIGQLNGRINEIDKRVRIISTPKELQALEHERESLLSRRGALEDSELEIMEQLEQLDARMSSLSERIEALGAQADAATVAVAEADAQLDADETGFVAQRAPLVESITATLLTRYETMRPKLGGIAVAALEHGHCSGCRLQLPATELDRLRHAADGDVVICEQCGRILVR